MEDSNLHLTLVFLGELSEAELKILTSGLQRFEFPKFRLAISGLGTFPEVGEPRILWAGINKSLPLLNLQKQLNQELVKLIGYQPEDRDYSPHVTLARINSDAATGELSKYLDSNREIEISPFLVEEIVLFSSDFEEARKKITYRPEHTFSLK